MDKYLTMFSEELDAAFNPETLFPEKDFYTMRWLKLKLMVRKNVKKLFNENSTVNKNAAIKYAS
jgi:hypothetical protein